MLISIERHSGTVQAATPIFRIRINPAIGYAHRKFDTPAISSSGNIFQIATPDISGPPCIRNPCHDFERGSVPEAIRTRCHVAQTEEVEKRVYELEAAISNQVHTRQLTTC